MSTPEERSAKARLASHASWARTADRTARTAPATAASVRNRELEREVDPTGVLSKADRASRAESLRQSRIAAAELAVLRQRRLSREAAEAADVAAVQLAALQVAQ